MKRSRKFFATLFLAGAVCAGTCLTALAAEDIPPLDWPDENNYYGITRAQFGVITESGEWDDDYYQDMVEAASEEHRDVANSPSLRSGSTRMSGEANYSVITEGPLEVEMAGEQGEYPGEYGVVVANAAATQIPKAITADPNAVTGNQATVPAADQNAANNQIAPIAATTTANDHPNTGSADAVLPLLTFGLSAIGIAFGKKR